MGFPLDKRMMGRKVVSACLTVLRFLCNVMIAKDFIAGLPVRKLPESFCRLFFSPDVGGVPEHYERRVFSHLRLLGA